MSKGSQSVERIDWDWTVAHGALGSKDWPLPRLVAKSDLANRADQGNQIKANEYYDEPEVLKAKAKVAADLIKQAQHCVAYTGAGLSRTAGIPDYASKSKESVVSGPQLKSPLDAVPTKAHCIIAHLANQNMIHHYVQQNHDGLPQKAGYPQESINEIHGAWFDPANPVVPMSGTLRGDLFAMMEETETKTDLCLCLGTSLSGMNADRMAVSPAKAFMAVRAGEKYPDKAICCKVKKPLGTVVVNLQRTPFDTEVGATIRIWGKLDEVFTEIAIALGLDPEVVTRPLPVLMPTAVRTKNVFVVPYDEKGKASSSKFTKLDLRVGATIRICPPEACNFNCEGKIVGSDDEGNFTVAITEERQGVSGIVRRRMGRWWVRAALLKTTAYLPVCNINPVPATAQEHKDMVASLKPEK